MRQKMLLCILVGVLLLSACSATHEEWPGLIPPDYSGPVIDVGSYHASSVGQYKDILNKIQERLVDDFVPYSAFSCFGAFHSFDTHQQAKYIIYNYSFTDANNEIVNISVRHRPGFEFVERLQNIIPFPKGITNVCYIDGLEGKKDFARHGLTYIYAHGTGFKKLICFTWIDHDIQYTINVDRFSEYPVDGKETIVSRLLSIDENVSKAAFEELKAHMKANMPPRPVWPYFVGSSVLIAAVVLIALLSYRRIKTSST